MKLVEFENVESTEEVVDNELFIEACGRLTARDVVSALALEDVKELIFERLVIDLKADNVRLYDMLFSGFKGLHNMSEYELREQLIKMMC